MPRPVHLSTTASPLTNDDGAILGVLLVTRNVTVLKQAQVDLQKALKDKTNQLLEIQNGVRRIAATFQPSSSAQSEQRTGGGLHTRAFLSRREHAVLDLLRTGVRSRSIAHTLGISIETVRRHLNIDVPEDRSPLTGCPSQAVFRCQSTESHVTKFVAGESSLRNAESGMSFNIETSEY